LAKHNGPRQKADGNKGFHPVQKLNPHARYVTRPLGQDQRLGELMTHSAGPRRLAGSLVAKTC
jgi:hypothetical protein